MTSFAIFDNFSHSHSLNYCMIRILPQAMYERDDIHKILRDGQSCVLYKEIGETTLHKEGFVSTHALTLVLQGRLKVERIECGTEIVNAGQMIFYLKDYILSPISCSRIMTLLWGWFSFSM